MTTPHPPHPPQQDAHVTDWWLARPVGDLTATRLARIAVGDRGNHPVDLVAGAQAPTPAGVGWYYTTPGGKMIRHPSAYDWPKVYHRSTRRVEVGRDWIARQAVRGWRESDSGGVRCYVDCGSRVYVHGHRVEGGYTASGKAVWLVTAADDWTYHAARRPDSTSRAAVREALAARTKQRRETRAWVRNLELQRPRGV